MKKVFYNYFTFTSMKILSRLLLIVIFSINGHWMHCQNLVSEHLKPNFSSEISYTNTYWDNTRFDTINWKHATNTRHLQKMFIKYLVSFKGQRDSLIINNFETFLNIPYHTKESITFFYDLFEKYLFNPNSPIRSEKLFRAILTTIIHSSKVTELQKSRMFFLLKMINKNRVGQISTDFTYENANGSLHSLFQIKSSYILLHFSNTDCAACQKIYKEMIRSNIVQKMLAENNLKILTIELNEKTMPSSIYPNIKNWIFGKEVNNTIEDNSLFFIQALPSLYLLDKNKKILIKDGYLKDIESYLK